MGRAVIVAVIALSLAPGVAQALDDMHVVRVAETVGAERLWSLGMLYLADLGDTYLVEGDGKALERLARVTQGFDVITTVERGTELFLLRAKSPEYKMIHAKALIEVAPGHYLAKLERDAIDDLKLLPFSRMRLIPRRFALPEARTTPPIPAALTPRPEIEILMARVSGDTLWQYISQLSGNEPAVINGVPDTLLTRYSYSWRIHHAADYLRERFESYGYDTGFHQYLIGKYDFYWGDFVDTQNGWIVGTKQRVFRTRDGGLSWVRQRPNAPFQAFTSVCFLDTLEGWIVGTSAHIFHTTDGGASWEKQDVPGGFFDDLEAVWFMDSHNGWTVGVMGKVARTTDGGANWLGVPSGSLHHLWNLHFESLDRGWISGGDGTILFWNGTSLSSLNSGTTETLYDIEFVDDNRGWAVGGNRTVIKTTDGGQTWSAQTVPAQAHPYLTGACFLDSTEGWVVGLGGTVLHTTDGGANWQIGDVGTLQSLFWVEFIDTSEAWTAGDCCAVLHTFNGGAAWENQQENLPAGSSESLENVVATKPGTVSDEQVIICGHYDCVSDQSATMAPGADDNASGTAAVIEAARVMAPYPYEKSIKFVCFSAEEQGLFGSLEYAADAKHAGDVITGVINLDMIGYVNAVPEDIDFIGNPTSEWLADFAIACANAYVPTLPALKDIEETLVYSDHASFWFAGYDAILGIEDHPIVNPNYHSTSDTLGYLNQPFVTDVTKAGIATLAELAVPDTAAAAIALKQTEISAAVHPNPLRSAATISYALQSAGDVEICVFDTRGRLIRDLLSQSMGPGRYKALWDGKNQRGFAVSPGVYLVRVKIDQAQTYAKVIVLR
jgi:photosystem II stability/assembly factor-like uncharacterized protein